MNDHQDQLFTTIGDMSKDGYFIFDTENRHFSYFNEALCGLLALSPAVVLATPLVILEQVHPEDKEHAVWCFEECLQDRSPKKYELRLRVGGQEKYVRCSVFPIDQGNGLQLCGNLEDVTIDRHNKIHIEQINARKNVTLEVLSHDLKEPLGLMHLTASAISKDVEKTGNKRLVDSLGFIRQMCERNMKLVRSIINHEFLKSSIIAIKKERVDLVWELQDVIRTYRKSHLRELKDFRFESSAEKIYLFLDTMKFTQVVNNLISNAIKFTTDQGIIAVGLADQADSVLVTVSDNGIGIPDELKPELFEKGGKALRPGLAGEESGGLGMSIVKSIVALHQGKIWFESTAGIGTTFFISLPK